MERNKLFLFNFLFLFLFISASCSRYQMKQIPYLPTRGADLYPQQENKGGLIIAVDDYFDTEKSYQVFGIDFTERDILVLEVIVSNRSNSVYSIKGHEIFLVDEGKVIYPLPLSKLEISPKNLGGYFQFLEFQDIIINPGESKHGFLYFKMPREREETFSFLWTKDFTLRLGASKVSGDTELRLIYTIILRNF